MNESRCRICLFVFPKFIPLECSENSSTADGMSPLGGIRGLAGGLSALAPASSDLTIQQTVRQGRRLDPLGQGYEILSLESFDTLTEQFRLCRTKYFVTFERGRLSSGDVEFIFFCATAASGTKTVTEMPTVTSLSKRMTERFVFGRLTQLFLFVPVSFPFTHIMTRLRAVTLAAVISLALLAQGGLVRFGERGSRRVQWFRLGERGGMTTKASSRDWSPW